MARIVQTVAQQDEHLSPDFGAVTALARELLQRAMSTPLLNTVCASASDDLPSVSTPTSGNKNKLFPRTWSSRFSPRTIR